MAVDNLPQYEGKTVTLVRRKPNGETEELKGKVEAVSPTAIAFKPKGKAGVELVESANIVSITIEEAPAKKLKQRKVGFVPTERIKQHLLQQHGASLSRMNAVTNKEAEEIHARIDHSDLGHLHVADPKASSAPSTDREAAIAAAEAKRSGG